MRNLVQHRLLQQPYAYTDTDAVHGTMCTYTEASTDSGTAPVTHDAVIRVYDESGNVIETHEHKGDFKEWRVNVASTHPKILYYYGLQLTNVKVREQRAPPVAVV